MKLLLLSNSTNAGEEYLAYPEKYIKKFLGTETSSLLFIPYAAVTISYVDYSRMVSSRFEQWGYNILSLHSVDNVLKAVEDAKGLVVGGGNTFRLLSLLQENSLMEIIKEKVMNGTPYIGWSAGSNICCPTIQTTNDMPICEPIDFKALNLVPFQINPHYTDVNPPGFAGETRPMRIKEYIEVNPGKYVVGLREGSALLQTNGELKLLGPNSASLYRKGDELKELKPGRDLDFLLV